MGSQQTSEEALRRSTISLLLEIHIKNLAILIHSSPQVVLFAIDLHEDFVDVEGISVASMLTLQSAA